MLFISLCLILVCYTAFTEHSFCLQLSRKAISDAFLTSELPQESEEGGNKPALKYNAQREAVMKEIECQSVFSISTQPDSSV